MERKYLESLYVVILAGGKGERFWPLSTPSNPKPFLRFFSAHSLIQQTFERARALVPVDRILLVVGVQHSKLSLEQLPELPISQVLLEPAGRDTSAAIAYASRSLPPDATMLIMPADHLIPDQQSFALTMEQAARFVDSNPQALVTFGVKPDRPETHYGYIQAQEKNVGSANLPVYSIERFVEKPDRVRAEAFLREGSYYWNSGIFLWKNSRIRECLQKHLPDLWSKLQEVSSSNLGTTLEKIYPELPRISIDYGVMEKAEHVFVVPAPFEWDDVGTWNSLLRILPVNSSGNLIFGNHVSIDSNHCLIYAETQTIATAGVENLIIVQHGNQTLICTREYADRLKELLSKLSS